MKNGREIFVAHPVPPNGLEKCNVGFYRGRKRNGGFSDEAICAGLSPERVLVYAEWA